ncbi:hypothetical protein CYQ27_04145 [Enterococcus faecalis]|nr:hypothetical protein CUM65_04000 [Enterococcus faecalis]PQG36870.1 hypothetical protein CUS34_11615 [Enterococcus faecalis]RXV23850.1 hypothetical protein CYQ36_02065 [Enterococcus faecalis]RXV25062.1 hypothetical protein CYQ38_02660 [Enterococcus faecalis]RXV47115.1 hypothetical protein CYQ27_04145 [Enterococcus faecalis]
MLHQVIVFNTRKLLLLIKKEREIILLYISFSLYSLSGKATYSVGFSFFMRYIQVKLIYFFEIFIFRKNQVKKLLQM